MTKILRKYLSDFGTTYVQVDVGARLELNFDHDPSQAEVDSAVAKLPKDVPAVEPVMKSDLTVETAIAYLEQEYLKVADLKTLDATQTKLVELMKPVALAEAVK